MSCPDFKLSLFLVAPPRPRPHLKANTEYRTPNSECRSCLASASFTSTFDIRYSAVHYSLFMSFDVRCCASHSFSDGWFKAQLLRLPAIPHSPFSSSRKQPPKYLATIRGGRSTPILGYILPVESDNSGAEESSFYAPGIYNNPLLSIPDQIVLI